MKRSIRKAIAFIVALALFIPLFNAPAEPVSAALSDFTYYDTSVWNYSGTDKDIELPLFDSSVTEVNFNFYGEKKSFESFTLGEGYTSAYLIYIDSLKKVSLPSTLTTLSITSCPELTEITIPGECKKIDIFNCPKLTKINFEAPVRSGDDGYTYVSIAGCGVESLHIPSGFTDVTLSECASLKDVYMEEGTNGLYLYTLPSLKSLNIPNSVDDIIISYASYKGIKSSDRFKLEKGGLYIDNELWSVDTTQETITVKEGTRSIKHLALSSGSAITTINLPDTIEEIGAFAFSGGVNLKKVNIPKNVLTIGEYAFEDTAIKEITIPASVRCIRDSAFANYYGNVTLDKDNTNFESFNKGIYRISNYEDYKDVCLIYYPAKATSITFRPGTTSIDMLALNCSSVKKLVLPETLNSFYCDLYRSAVESLSVPASVEYLDRESILSAPNLKTLTISPDNQYYSSYKNCLYNKAKTLFKAAPQGLKNITIYKGCLSASYDSLNLKSWESYYDDNKDYKPVTVTIPKSIVSIDSITCDKAYVYADSDAVAVILMQNEDYRAYGKKYDYDPTPYIIDYEFLDSNASLLRSVWVVDEISVKAGRKKTVDFSLPNGMALVKKLTTGKNTEMTVRFSSSNKKVAKVSATTGKITGVKKGTCKITATFTINNGKKKTSKKFTVNVKVK